MDKLIYVVPVLGGPLASSLPLSSIVGYRNKTPVTKGCRRSVPISPKGAMAFLKAEWKILSYFVIIAALLLAVMGYSNHDSHWSIAVAFVIGAVLSATAGYDRDAQARTKANVRTAHAARTSLSKALKVSFNGGFRHGFWRRRSGSSRPRRFVHYIKGHLCSRKPA